ncbi:MAG: NAD(+)/NADH kinase [Candidatus Hodarchaeales archaeon]
MVEVSDVGIFSHILFEETIAIIEEILSLDTDNSISFFINPDLYDFLIERKPELTSYVKKVPLSEMNVDCIISIGGDGTILRLARTKPETPILSINKGRKGFMTEIDPENVTSSMKDFLKGKFRLEEHKKILARIDGAKQGSAINEILITSVDLLKPIDFRVMVDEEVISASAADGIIIATPVGSTGHNLSSGGCIIDPSLDNVIISWINPINLAIRPVILGASRKLQIICSTRINPIKMVFDGQVSIEYTTPVNFTIAPSEESVKFYRKQHFTTRWNQHLHPELRD